MLGLLSLGLLRVVTEPVLDIEDDECAEQHPNNRDEEQRRLGEVRNQDPHDEDPANGPDLKAAHTWNRHEVRGHRYGSHYEAGYEPVLGDKSLKQGLLLAVIAASLEIGGGPTTCV